jgi:alginate O-acetyltransferase complex protein AlgI
MVFSSLTFLYFFLPCVTVLYYISKNRLWRNGVLLIFSLVFYSWGEPKYILLLLLAAAEAYIGGLIIDAAAQRPRRKKTAMAVTAVLLLANLFVFKYLGFVCGNLGILVRDIVLPIGISFYTFQILSYVIDLYRGKTRVQKNYLLLLLYVSFFPQLIAGPIVRYQTVEMEMASRSENWDDFTGGLRRFVTGLAKKVLIANNVAQVATIIYAGNTDAHGTAAYWVASLAYTLQIYFDFSGYSDMAIGMGRMFGFHFLENFDYPYISKSITEFWRRWHISLSTWFRDYVYIPLGGNRKGAARQILNICIVWALTGIWHGAAWNFLAWGVYYAVLLLLEKFVYGKYLEKLPGFFRWFYAMFFVNVGWVLFNLVDVAELEKALRIMFVWHSTDWAGVFASNTALMTELLYLPIAVVCCLPIKNKLHPIDGLPGAIIENVWYVGLLAMCIMFILSSSYNPFIYFRF